MKGSIRLLEKPTTVLNYYKKAGLLVPIGVSCTWKCKGCINKQHKDDYVVQEYKIKEIIELYEKNHFVESLIFAGLEPFDNASDLTLLISVFRLLFEDDVIIYTGYDMDDIHANTSLKWAIYEVFKYNNVIIKFGRYIPDRKKIYDEILGIELASDNQWAFLSNEIKNISCNTIGYSV